MGIIKKIIILAVIVVAAAFVVTSMGLLGSSPAGSSSSAPVIGKQFAYQPYGNANYTDYKLSSISGLVSGAAGKYLGINLKSADLVVVSKGTGDAYFLVANGTASSTLLALCGWNKTPHAAVCSNDSEIQSWVSDSQAILPSLAPSSQNIASSLSSAQNLTGTIAQKQGDIIFVVLTGTLKSSLYQTEVALNG